jgi:hypothetical protein
VGFLAGKNSMKELAKFAEGTKGVIRVILGKGDDIEVAAVAEILGGIFQAASPQIKNQGTESKKGREMISRGWSWLTELS